MAHEYASFGTMVFDFPVPLLPPWRLAVAVVADLECAFLSDSNHRNAHAAWVVMG